MVVVEVIEKVTPAVAVALAGTGTTEVNVTALAVGVTAATAVPTEAPEVSPVVSTTNSAGRNHRLPGTGMSTSETLRHRRGSITGTAVDGPPQMGETDASTSRISKASCLTILPGQRRKRAACRCASRPSSTWLARVQSDST